MSADESASKRDQRPRAVLVAVKLPEVDERSFQSSMDELERLVTTLGYEVTGRVTQAREALAPGAVLGDGKLRELAELTGGRGEFAAPTPQRASKAKQRWRAAEAHDSEPEPPESAQGEPAASTPERIALIAVDQEISPSQARNLERACGVPVLDRTGVIIDIFHRHARSQQAKLQVELARLAYTAPRLRESPSGRERQRGRGAGDAALELDRRKIRDRMAELRRALQAGEIEQKVRQKARQSARTVALVGYTNAGKSSLMRALTGSEVLVQDKLFATLDTTVRALVPEVTPRVLISDTVGFIKQLPHDLVASFRSTLDEAANAALQLHVVDAADADWRAQHAVTLQVLAEIGAAEVPRLLLLNKTELLSAEQRQALQREQPEALLISTREPASVALVRTKILEFFQRDYVHAELLFPYDRQALLAEVHRLCLIERSDYQEAGVRVQLRAPAEQIERWTRALDCSSNDC